MVKKVTKEKFCMCCKSKDNLQASINLLSDPAYLCSKCISDYDGWKKRNWFKLQSNSLH